MPGKIYFHTNAHWVFGGFQSARCKETFWAPRFSGWEQLESRRGDQFRTPGGQEWRRGWVAEKTLAPFLVSSFNK